MANRKELEKTLAEVGVELSDEKLGKVEKELEAKGELSLEELEAVAGGLSDTAKKNLIKAGIGALAVAGAGLGVYNFVKGGKEGPMGPAGAPGQHVGVPEKKDNKKFKNWEQEDWDEHRENMRNRNFD